MKTPQKSAPQVTIALKTRQYRRGSHNKRAYLLREFELRRARYPYRQGMGHNECESRNRLKRVASSTISNLGHFRGVPLAINHARRAVSQVGESIISWGGARHQLVLKCANGISRRRGAEVIALPWRWQQSTQRERSSISRAEEIQNIATTFYLRLAWRHRGALSCAGERRWEIENRSGKNKP